MPKQATAFWRRAALQVMPDNNELTLLGALRI
jgi:hypothetical protein